MALALVPENVGSPGATVEESLLVAGRSTALGRELAGVYTTLR